MTRSEMRKALKTRRRRSLSAVALVAGAVVASSAFVALAPAQAATAGCFETDLTAERWEDGRGVVIFATNADQAAEAAAAGFAPTGESFALSSERQRGLVPLYDAFRERTGNHAWMLWDHEYRNVVKAGWEGRGILGYVSPKPLADCTAQVKMTRGVKGALHTVESDAGALAAQGYRTEYSWYAPADETEPEAPVETPTPTPTPTAEPTAQPTVEPTPEPTVEPSPEPTVEPTPQPTVPPAPEPEPEPEPVDPEPVPPVAGDGDGEFTIATYPDTQQEVFSWAGSRFLQRSQWLVAQADALDLRFVAHIGDVVNYVSDGYPQYVIAEAAFDPFEAAGIPYQLSIGNHDTMATGPGGGARDPKRTREYQRTTTVFNQFWKAADYGAVSGAYESGKVDNTYSTFSAEGANWLVLNLELWPRAGVVDWAEDAIASHPTHNVVIQTHSFLEAGGNIDGAGQAATRWSYGDSSPQYVYDRLVAPYANVKVVMSGHTGSAVSKTVTTAKGNTVAYLLQAIHSNNNNPVRLSTFDVAAGTIDTEVYAPEDGATWDTNVLTGLSFITG